MTPTRARGVVTWGGRSSAAAVVGELVRWWRPGSGRVRPGRRGRGRRRWSSSATPSDGEGLHLEHLGNVAFSLGGPGS